MPGSLLDLGNYPEIFACGVAEVQSLGTNIRGILFDWYKFEGIWRRRIVAVITRPGMGIDYDTEQWRQAVSCPPSLPVVERQMRAH